MSDTTLTPTATLRYVGVADWWGFHVWIEEGGSRRTLPYRGEAALAELRVGAPRPGRARAGPLDHRARHRLARARRAPLPRHDPRRHRRAAGARLRAHARGRRRVARGRPHSRGSMTSMRTTRPSRNEHTCVTSPGVIAIYPVGMSASPFEALGGQRHRHGGGLVHEHPHDGPHSHGARARARARPRALARARPRLDQALARRPAGGPRLARRPRRRRRAADAGLRRSRAASRCWPTSSTTSATPSPPCRSAPRSCCAPSAPSDGRAVRRRGDLRQRLRRRGRGDRAADPSRRPEPSVGARRWPAPSGTRATSSRPGSACAPGGGWTAPR